MGRDAEGRRTAPRLTAALAKYKYVAIVLLAGIICLAWPSSDKGTASPPAAEQRGQGETGERQELIALQEEMEDILGKIQGVGELRLMLTLDRGTFKELAQDGALSYSGEPISPEDYSRSSSTVVLSKSGSGESVVVIQETYPQFRGALVVCQGGENPSVRLAVIEAVSALTGLGSDKISVVKWQS